MKSRYRIAIGLIGLSWFATSSLWLMQKRNRDIVRDAQIRRIYGLENDRSRMDINPRSHDGDSAANDARDAGIMTIKAQLEAFKHEDYAKALEYQSDELRRALGSVAKFRAMIVSGYPQLAHYKSVSFGQHRMNDSGRLAIGTIVTGSNGSALSAIYVLVYEDNRFRIAGVRRVQLIEQSPEAQRLQRSPERGPSLMDRRG